MSDALEILCEKRGSAGILTLNRPKALNALSHVMVRGMYDALMKWQDDPEVTSVIVKGAGDKAFCAGGDVRTLRALCLDGKREEALAFWREEYRLNMLIKHYPKPYVSLIGGIVMGGGVGVSLHGSHRVAGENYLFAMPEVGIGFFPDVGVSYPLARLPSHMGAFLATTGERIRRDDAFFLGLATHAADISSFEEIERQIAAGEDVNSVLRVVTVPIGQSLLGQKSQLIDQCFSAPDVPELMSRLQKASNVSPFAKHILQSFTEKSPTSIHIAFEQIQRAGMLDFKGVLEMDYRLSSRLCEPGQDFFEGVRAVLVDKDGKPNWHPATLETIDPATIKAYFYPLPSGDFKAV